MSPPSVGFVVPTWNRASMLWDCIGSLLKQDYPGKIGILVVDDQSTDDTPLVVRRCMELAEESPHPREVKLQAGPGRSNWRPGAIHRPFFEYALTCKHDFVGYQFSDDYSSPSRVRDQVMNMELSAGPGTPRHWSFCSYTVFVDADKHIRRQIEHDFDRHRDMVATRGPTLPVYSFLVRRREFIEVGGCDYPFHAGANAEAWIIAHCGLMGDPAPAGWPMYFRVHEEALGSGQGPGSSTYNESVSITGFMEEDHWRLWEAIRPVYEKRVSKARLVQS